MKKVSPRTAHNKQQYVAAVLGSTFILLHNLLYKYLTPPDFLWELIHLHF